MISTTMASMRPGPCAAALPPRAAPGSPLLTLGRSVLRQPVSSIAGACYTFSFFFAQDTATSTPSASFAGVLVAIAPSVGQNTGCALSAQGGRADACQTRRTYGPAVPRIREDAQSDRLGNDQVVFSLQTSEYALPIACGAAHPSASASDTWTTSPSAAPTRPPAPSIRTALPSPTRRRAAA